MDEKSFAFTTSQLQHGDRLHNKNSGAPNCLYKVKITRQIGGVCVSSDCTKPRDSELLCVCVCKEGDQASSADSPVC